MLGDSADFNPIQVSIGQFYGIEINDFAVTVAKTALWIAESQMLKETEEIVHMHMDFLPLTSYANIVEGNALRIDWEDVVPKEKLNYIMGNPPFVGYGLQDKSQKNDILSIYVDEKMTSGNRPADGGHLIIEESEYEDFINKEPKALPYIRRLSGATEFINNKKRWCLWLVNVSPAELRKMPEVMKRIELCRQDRLSGAEDRQKLALTPSLFRETKNPDTAIVVPRHSSENRKYIPFGFIGKEMILTDAAMCIPNASVFDFGVLESNVHMAWVRAVCGRIKSDYRYSKDIVYNNFPWPAPTDEQRKKIEQTAQAILDARALYPDCSLADLYDEVTMPPELRKAHQQNDKAVMQAYGFWGKLNTETECVAELMKMYQELTK